MRHALDIHDDLVRRKVPTAFIEPEHKPTPMEVEKEL